MTAQPAMLQFDWEDVDGSVVDAVLAKGACRLSDGSLACEEIAFIVRGQAVVLRVNADTDEVIVSLETFSMGEADWQPLEQLEEVVGHELGWCWIGRNYRGYLDTFTIALDGIDPTYSFIGMASSLHCTRLTPISA
jgi:hypothetical protein